MKHHWIGFFFVLLSSIAQAVPSVDDARTELGNGNAARAEHLMAQMVAARPNSARARFVYAEVLAHNKRYDRALEEARRAREIDPSLKFTSPERFANLMQQLEREQVASRAGAAVIEGGWVPASGTLLGVGLGIALLVLIAASVFRLRHHHRSGRWLEPGH